MKNFVLRSNFISGKRMVFKDIRKDIIDYFDSFMLKGSKQKEKLLCERKF